MTHQSLSQIGTWNGWTEREPPPPSMQQIGDSLIKEIDRELQPLPIKSQIVIVAARHEGEGYWTVDILDTPPPHGTYDTWTACLVDFDQYVGSTESIRQGAAEALADELMEEAFPGWRDPDYGKPEPPDWEVWN